MVEQEPDVENFTIRILHGVEIEVRIGRAQLVDGIAADLRKSKWFPRSAALMDRIFRHSVAKFGSTPDERLKYYALLVAEDIATTFKQRLPAKVEIALRSLIAEAMIYTLIDEPGKRNMRLKSEFDRFTRRERQRMGVRRGGSEGPTLSSFHIVRLLAWREIAARMFECVPRKDRGDSSWIDAIKSTPEYKRLKPKARKRADVLCRRVAGGNLTGQNAEPRMLALQFAADHLGLDLGPRQLLRRIREFSSKSPLVATAERRLQKKNTIRRSGVRP